MQCFADDRGIVTVGDNQPGAIGQEAFACQQRAQFLRHRPEEAIAKFEIVGPFAADEGGAGGAGRAGPRASVLPARAPRLACSGHTSALATLISTMVNAPLASIAIMSARRPLGKGTSQMANRSWRQNSRVTPRATSAAIGDKSAKHGGRIAAASIVQR